jgi:PAS domain S-box-containing protein
MTEKTTKNASPGPAGSVPAKGTDRPALPHDDCRIPEDRYRVFIEDVADGFYETDLQGNFIFFNKAMCRIFGYREEEIRGRNFRKFMDAANSDYAFTSFNKIFESGRQDTVIVWEILRKDGQRRILEISANLIYDEKGRRTGFRGIARDMTEKYKARQALETSRRRAREQYRASRQAELRYRAFLEFLPDPVFVFGLDHTVSYLNPAFESVFGWSLAELKGKRIPFVPDDEKAKTIDGLEILRHDKLIQGFETRRLTRDGRILDIILDGAIFYDEHNQAAGQVVTLRDVTREKRLSRSNQALFRIAKALHQFRKLDDRLNFIAREVQTLIDVGGASVILLDEKREEFFFRVAAYEDRETGRRIQELRFPADKGVAGEVYRTGRPLIVPDTSRSPFFFQQVDDKAGYRTRSMLDVPIQLENRMIGVLCAVNKKAGGFDQTDVELLSTIASMVALPIENARINEALEKSYEEVTGLNRAKDRVIHRLSHELKTPVSVLSASLALLGRKMAQKGDPGPLRILDRAGRNLQRILDMQYQVEDILRDGDYQTHRVLSLLLDTCSDELEMLFAEVLDEPGPDNDNDNLIRRVREKIDALFAPRDDILQQVDLSRFVPELLGRIGSKFAHRGCRVIPFIEPAPCVRIPIEVLEKIIEGLVRNAVENTPDQGQIEVMVHHGVHGPVLTVRDFGVGVTAEHHRMLLESYVSTTDPMLYASKKRYDFNAGGKGFDLLRMKIFSERYHFKIDIASSRCMFIPGEEDLCPGRIADCVHCSDTKDCLNSGGTTVTVRFETEVAP